MTPMSKVVMNPEDLKSWRIQRSIVLSEKIQKQVNEISSGSENHQTKLLVVEGNLMLLNSLLKRIEDNE